MSKLPMYAVYDLKDNEQCLGIFVGRKQVAEYFNTTVSCIRVGNK